MPLTVKRDPNSPTGWSWVDAQTGELGVQPGGPGTTIVAPSELTPEQQQQLAQQQAQDATARQQAAAVQQQQAAANAAVEKRILNNFGRSDWQIVGRTDEQKSQTQIDPTTGQATSALKPTGNVIWAIAGPNGQGDTIVVHPSGTTAGDFDVVDPPKPVTKTPSGYSGTSWINGELWGTNQQTGAFEKVAGAPSQAPKPERQQVNGVWYTGTPDPTTGKITWTAETGLPTSQPSSPDQWVALKDPAGRTIAMQDPKTGEKVAVSADKPQLVQGQGGALYSWDGTKLNTLKEGQAKEGDTRQVVQNGRNTTQTYQGGDWVTTSIGDSAIPGAPVEGGTRNVIQNGYNTTQTYQGGEWTTTGIGTRATPATPTVVNAPTTEPYITTMTDGQISSQPSPNFIPKTATDVAARVAQLQSLAQAQRDQLLQQQQSGAITADQAAQKFDQWWSQTVEPQKAVLDVAQRQAAITQQQTQATEQRANYATALQAGQNAVEAAKAQLPYMAGPGFGQALNQIAGAFASGKLAGNLDLASAVTFQMPDLNQLAQQATNQALAHISPTAAANMNTATGPNTPNFDPGMAQSQNMDITQALNRTNYSPTTTIAPDGTVTVQHAAPQPSPPPGGYAQNQPGTYGVYSGPMPSPGGYAPNQPGTYGVLTGSMPQLSQALAPYQLT